MANKPKYPELPKNVIIINQKALLARVNRKWKAEGKPLQVRVDRNSGNRSDFYILDTKRKTIKEMNVDLQELARKMGVLQKYEMLVEGGE